MKKTQSRWLKNRVKNGRKKKLKLSQLNWWCMSEWADPGTSKGYWGKRVSKEKGLVPYLGIFISPLSSLLWTFNNFKWLLVIGTTKDFTSDHFWTSGGHFKCVCSTLLLKRDWSPYLGTTNTFSSISPKAKNDFGWKFVRLFIRARQTKNV